MNLFSRFRSVWLPADKPAEALHAESYEGIPASIRGRVALLDGVLHMSKEVQGNLDMLALVADLKIRGINHWEWHDPAEFDAKYAKIIFAPRQENDEKAYAVDLIAKAHARKASDIHILDRGSYVLVRFRVMGMMQDYTPLPVEFGRQIISCLYSSMGASQSTPVFSPMERMDARIVNRDYLPRDVHSIRLHIEPTECATGTGRIMLLRLLYDSTGATGTLEERTSALGFTAHQQDILRMLTNRTGLVIVSGPTGHGKSTFLKHIMESMAEERPQKSYLASEDPPEFPMHNVEQVLVSTNTDRLHFDDRKRGQAYTDAIAGAMRSDPDVLMIGEIRYPEAAAAAVNAALTGHAVFVTLHANNAFGIIPRMQSLLNSAGYVAPLDHLCDPNVLAGLTYQRLIPVLCPDCKRKLMDLVEKEPALRRVLVPDSVFRHVQTTVKDMDAVFVRGKGCPTCKGEGFVSQTVAAEVVAPDQKMLALLREGKGAEAYDYWVREHEGLSYVRHAARLVQDGLADPVETENRLGVPLNFDKTFARVS